MLVGCSCVCVMACNCCLFIDAIDLSCVLFWYVLAFFCSLMVCMCCVWCAVLLFVVSLVRRACMVCCCCDVFVLCCHGLNAFHVYDCMLYVPRWRCSFLFV